MKYKQTMVHTTGPDVKLAKYFVFTINSYPNTDVCSFLLSMDAIRLSEPENVCYKFKSMIK